MPSPRQESGSKSETLAAALLSRKGYQVLAQNVRVGKIGEIDLICEDHGVRVFVEVRSRGSRQGASALEAITPAKVHQVRRTVLAHLAWNPHKGPWRIDIVAIQFSPEGKLLSEHHFENVTM